MAKKRRKIVAFSLLAVVILMLLVSKIIFFDFVKVKGSSNLTEYNKNSLLVVQKNKTPDFADILLIETPINKNQKIIRCIAKPGDEFEIINSEIFINNQPILETFVTIKKYRVNCFNSSATDKLLNHYKLSEEENILGVYNLNLTKKMADSLLKDSLIMIKPIIVEAGLGNDSIFPQSFKYRWNEDNFGQLTIPYKGFSIELNDKNYSLYKNTIYLFEGKIIEKNQTGDVLINGNITSNYIFENDYYFVMNDDRTNFNDSRKWGIIPTTIIKGVVITSL
ncbi:MAG: signal peptidase I [Bacteroidales bacterium]|nr:signal peptidase I [Bacteroidales bacterium]